MAELHLDVQKKLYEELCKKYPDCPAMWKYFLCLTEIPRPSHHTAKVSAWIQEVGKKLGGSVKADALGNVCIAFPATKGKENVPGVVLQAHLDMVPTKTADLTFNFETDPLVPYIDGELLRATKTTLGGDDGSGVAACLAIAEDKTIERGPLELLFTIDEETGLVGALALRRVNSSLRTPSTSSTLTLRTGEKSLSAALVVLIVSSASPCLVLPRALASSTTS